jgi:hypothetical protein
VIFPIALHLGEKCYEADSQGDFGAFAFVNDYADTEGGRKKHCPSFEKGSSSQKSLFL